MRLPYAAHRACADAGGLRHHVGSPVRGLAGRVGKRQRHDALGHFGTERCNARRPCLVAPRPLEAFLGEALLPAPHASLRLAGLPHDVDGADAVGAQQDDLGAPDVLLSCIAVLDERRQSLAIGWRNDEGNPCAHTPDSHAHSTMGIPNRTGLLC